MKYNFGGFELVQEGYHVAKVSDVKWDDKKDKDGEVKCRTCQVVLKVEGGSSDGMSISDFFQTESEGDFALGRLCGLMIKAGVLTEEQAQKMTKEDFLTEPNEQKITARLRDRMVGFKSEYQDSNYKRTRKLDDAKYSRITQYLTVKEVQDKMKGGATRPDSAAAAPEPPKSKPLGAWD